MTIRENVPLAPLTTFRIGGPARFFVEARTYDDVKNALYFAREKQLPLFVLGGGSNILVSDSGFEGVVLAVRISGIAVSDGGVANVAAGAGAPWDELVKWSVARGYTGLECLSGIPGTVGGAVVANIGAYGAECSDTLQSVEALDLDSYAPITFNKEDCAFSYHDSMFANACGRYLILKANFSFIAGGKPKLDYRDNRFDLKTLAGEGSEPTPASVRDVVLHMRKEKGVLADSYKCAGSFFHMPFVSRGIYERIYEVARALDAGKEERLRPWAWKQESGSYKLAPGFLLEYTGFQKGFERGSVGISPKHTLSIINIDKARAADVAKLATDMQDEVEKLFGIRLEREVEYVGNVEKTNSKIAEMQFENISAF